MRAQDAIWANECMSFVHFEITGAEFDQIVYLGQRLIDSQYVELCSALCNVSEFADEHWARDNSCGYNK